MFRRLLLRVMVLRRQPAAAAWLALIIACTVATALLNLYVDVEAKLRREFRNYGANLVLVSDQEQGFAPGTIERVEAIVSGHGLAVPFAYVVARTADGKSVVVAGTDFDEVRRLNSWWKVSAWPSLPRQALVGRRASPVVSPQGKPFALSFHGRSLTLSPAGTVETGASEDSRVYLSLAEFEAWTGLQPSTIEIAASGRADEISLIARGLSQAVSGAQVLPLRQVGEAEADVLEKTRATLLAASVLIILTSALCVASTLTGWIFDRRRDFAIMKALGASERLLAGLLAAEASVLGTTAALIGYGLGILVAAWIGRANFQAPVMPRLGVFPLILAGSVVVALISSLVPISLLRRVQPAMILKGE
jgi:putative ABC transport system permease protein